MAVKSPQAHIFEVGPRDGLQNEARTVSVADKVQFIRRLASAGLRQIEAGAFVREDRVPQMADTPILYKELRGFSQTTQLYSLVPNQKGLERALAAGAKKLALFTAATDAFATRNIGMSIESSLNEFKEVVKLGKKAGVQFRGYVSTAFGCPFEGQVSAKQALRVIERLVKLGVEQVSVGDTIGVATPNQVDAIVRPAIKNFGAKKIALHLHDTRGTALANALRGWQLGVRTLDASAGGLGGCPFAPGATGNLATEDLVYMLEGMGVSTGVDLPKLCEASLFLARAMNRPISSRYLSAYVSKKNHIAS